jgi:hypothetical protein
MEKKSKTPFNISEKKKIEGIFCPAYACKNKQVKKKGGLCHKHYARKRRKNNPIETRFLQFRENAKIRSKDFSITLEQFRLFCKKTGYLSKYKRGQNSTIDRRCNTQGYHIFNIQLLTNRQNASKGIKPSAECPF